MSESPARNFVRSPLGWLCAGLLAVAVLAAVVGGRMVQSVPPSERVLPTVDLKALTLREGRLFAEGAGVPFTGWVEDRHPAGALRSRSAVVAGRLHGPSQGWSADGVLLISEQFQDGLSDGPVTRWHSNGTRLSEGTARRGKLEGLFRRWHDNGVLAEELHLAAGVPVDLARSWHPSGCLKAEVRLDGGTVIAQSFWADGERPPQPELAVNGGAQ